MEESQIKHLGGKVRMLPRSFSSYSASYSVGSFQRRQ